MMSRLFSECTELHQFLQLSTLFISSFLLMIVIWIDIAGKEHILRILTDTAVFTAVYILLVNLNIVKTGYMPKHPSMSYDLFSGMPMAAVWCIAGVTLLWSVLNLIRKWQNTKHIPGYTSIMEAINTLPDAICFFTPDGRIKLCNLQMYRLYRLLEGRELQYYDEVEKSLRSCERYLKDDEYQEQILCFPDGSKWSYSESAALFGDRSYREIVLLEVTGLCHYHEELQSQLEDLHKMSQNLRFLSEQVGIMTREKEILMTKTRLHDQMGEGLTAVRQAILKNMDFENTEASLRLLKRSVHSLYAYNESTYTYRNKRPVQEEMEEFLRDAATIGTEVLIDGKVPENEDILSIFLISVREALTNSVRHADATILSVKIKDTADPQFTEIEITNNGRTVKGPVQPRGGLSNVRKHVEAAGGQMEILWEPDFRLRIRLPVKREESVC